MSGFIPSQLGLLANLTNFFVSWNHLSGSIPPQIGNCHSLVELGMNNNKFSGQLPESLGNLHNLLDFSFNNNKLTGTLSNNFVNLLLLSIFDISVNQISGTLPDISNFFQLKFLIINDNKLNGPINSDLSKLKNLTYFSLSNNKFTGTLSSELGYLSSLTYFDVSNNKLIGNIPNEFSQLCNLQVLFLTNNSFNRDLYHVFSSCQKSFTNIDISGNYFTGTVPWKIFNSTNLQSFAAVQNCMINEISEEICSSNSLVSLVLDGLNTAFICQNRIFPSFFDWFPDTYFADSLSTSTIPSCLYNISTLQTLHLSGNNLCGTLSKNLVITSNLQDLSLSNNILQDIIPDVIQLRYWISLDLSFNKFGGIINKNIDSISSNQRLLLENNRLSGRFPSSLVNAKNINVLVGNLFACFEDLPDNDSDYSKYVCGSNDFVLALIVIGLSLVIVMIFKTRIYKKIFKFESYLKTRLINNNYETEDNEKKKYWFYDMDNNRQILIKAGINKLRQKYISSSSSLIKLDIGDINNLEDQIEHSSNITSLCNLSEKLFLFFKYFFIILIIWLPISTLLSTYYKTYEYSFGWIVSSIYLSGYEPAYIMIILMTFTIIIVNYIIKLLFPSKEEYKIVLSIAAEKECNKIIQMEDEINMKSNYNITRRTALFFVIFINFLMMLSTNIIYVLAILNLNGGILIFIQIFIAGMKSFWKDMALPNLIFSIKNYFDVNDMVSSSHSKVINQQSSIFFQCSLGIMNNIYIPLFAQAIFNPVCFYNALVEQSPIQSFYYYAVCKTFSGSNECISNIYLTRTTSYLPPFTYSYQW